MSKSTSARRIAIGIAGLLVIAIGIFRLLHWPPNEAVQRFHAQLNDNQTAEDQLICPLIRAGSLVCPLVVRDIADPNAPLRRYAISALGSLGCGDAVPVLHRIVGDEHEPDYIRADALAALWLIEQPVAQSVSRLVVMRPDYLGQTALRLLEGYHPDTMSFWEALICSHE